jgi:hypothetical protein
MGPVDFLYIRLSAICFVIAILFFFFTTETLVRGKLKLPAWVFSLSTLVIGIYFFNIFLGSIQDFMQGRTDTLDELIDISHVVFSFFNFLV